MKFHQKIKGKLCELYVNYCELYYAHNFICELYYHKPVITINVAKSNAR